MEMPLYHASAHIRKKSHAKRHLLGQAHEDGSSNGSGEEVSGVEDCPENGSDDESLKWYEQGNRTK